MILLGRIEGEIMVEYQDLWNAVRDELEKELAPQSFQQTFGDVKRVIKYENVTNRKYLEWTANNAPKVTWPTSLFRMHVRLVRDVE